MLAWMARAVGLSGYTEETVPNDALAKLREDLAKETASLHEKLLVWREIKLNLIKSTPDFPFDLYETEHEHTKLSLRLLFSSLWNDIEEMLLPASMELNHLLTASRPHLQKLHDRLRDLCHQLNIAKGKEEAIKIRYEICVVSIAILGELLMLRNKISSELDYCLNVEELEERFANQFVSIMVEFFLKIPLPETNFTLSEQYRSFLYEQVLNKEGDVEGLVVVMEGTVEAAEKEVTLADEALPDDVKLSDSPNSIFHRSQKSENKPTPPQAIKLGM